MNHQQTRVQWKKFRFDYYVSGRLLMFSGLLESSLLMLSYSIETSLKALVAEFKTNEIQSAFGRVRNSHDLTVIYDFLVKYDICSKDLVSEDLLAYTTSNFNRYPSQVEIAKQKVSATSGNSIIDLSMITYFDDFIISLDNRLFEITQSRTSSILACAISQFDDYRGRAFFHQNFPAIISTQSLSDEDCRNSKNWNYDDAFVFKEIGHAALWGARPSMDETGAFRMEPVPIEEIAEVRLAKNFSFPKASGEPWKI